MLRSSDYGFQKMINIANRTRGLKAFVYCQADQKLSSSCHLTIVTMSQTSHQPVAKLSSIWQKIVVIGNPSGRYFAEGIIWIIVIIISISIIIIVFFILL